MPESCIDEGGSARTAEGDAIRGSVRGGPRALWYRTRSARTTIAWSWCASETSCWRHA